MSNLNPTRPEASDVDDLLRKYFQREMPAAWPACPRPTPPRQRRLVSLWSYRLPRVALAAAVALLFVGYLSVARWFPQDTAGIGLSPTAPEIGDFNKQRPHRPAAAPVRQDELDTKNKKN